MEHIKLRKFIKYVLILLFVDIILYLFLPGIAGIFIFVFLLTYLLWFLLKKFSKNIGLSTITIISCIAAVTLTSVLTYRVIGARVMDNYLERMNKQKIEITGHQLTVEEEEELKNKLSSDKSFKKRRFREAIKLSTMPSLFTIVILILLAREENPKKTHLKRFNKDKQKQKE